MRRPAAPPTDPPASPGDRTSRDRIVHAATAEFSLRGYDGGRIDAIARAAGVNKALLYYYFPSKQELYRGLVLDHLEAAGTMLAASADPTRPAGEALARIVETLLELAEARPSAPLLLVREVLNGWGHLRDEDFPVLLRLSAPIASTVERGVADGTFRPVPPLFVHLLLVGGMNFFLVSAPARARGSRIIGRPDIDPEPRAFVRFLADLVVRGLVVEPPSPSPVASEGAPR